MRFSRPFKFQLLAKTIGLALLFLCACGEEAPKRPKQGSTLVMLTSADYPPFEYYQDFGRNKEMVGFDIDLAQRIAKHLSYELEIMDTDFADVLATLSEKKAHLAMSAISVTPQREKMVAFSNPYYWARNVLLIPTNSSLVRGDDYTNKRIGVLIGSAQEQFAKIWQQGHKGVTIVAYRHEADMIKAIKTDKIDAALVEETPANAFVQKHPEALALHALKGDSTVFAIAFPKGSLLREDFNDALKHLDKIGELDDLKQKWFKVAKSSVS